MDTNSTILTSLGSITRGTANVTTAPHLNTTTNSSAASNILPSTSRVTSTSTLFAAVSATPIPPAADMAERVTKVAMDSNRLTISPFWVLGLLIVLFMVVSAWYLVVRFMFLGLLRPAFSHLITNTNEGTRNLIQSSYEKLGSSGRMITQVTLVLFFFALEQWLVVDTILEATAGEALKHHPSIDVILRIFAFLCQILCWFMVGELKKPKAAKNSKLRDARQKAEDKTNV
ncbi:hypothetical protein CB0940_04408 [Cercospora beticola]|uniref:Uncharacterized protein n=1 Tax=Cercospora beticola TaxID=122368 RepID=A0A2G5HKX0_CERBT|nr:hypothetical protein CB0940_04408 [Cercospora beticola]PIA93204.1 hypothetical protein CB0940_04408 [Cercospora beticola]WPB01647.1 hypothetical protein RHO25_006277 [Cercospora beticola]CAK1363545.1 unnamed protein product [Cercospora beticola]